MKQTTLSFGEQCYNYGRKIDAIIIDVASIEKLKEENKHGNNVYN